MLTPGVAGSLMMFVVGFGTANLAADATEKSLPQNPHAIHLFA